MQQKTKQLNCLKIKPFGSTVVLIAVLLFSGFLVLAYPSSIAYADKIFFPFISKSLEITLAWDQNLEPDLAGYKLYIGKSSRNYTQFVTLGRTTQYTFQNLINGTTYYFTLTAYNQSGLESSYSNEVHYP